ncbi:ArsR/SmtB family transcription factor [Roseovarius autotrophicus]|uniref:ArsR/SmtB family transcription factor n=1 Tax=Roseovarius autotrophicus TaxID=2824121 RepID=UPI0019E9E449|nr:metalloregulator ArsR/SmtB family transcription factor [Roseovarius autotrophicus]MBE0452577.1 winged helix-turn-helix transcriptional regulator [Roseovarius sp.]
MTLPDLSVADADMAQMQQSAQEAADFLRALGHEGRLMMLCHLVPGEKSVSELELLLGARQAAVSQQLARLRHEGLVQTRRDGKTIYYSLSDPRALRILEVLYEMFCAPDRQGRRP